MKKITALFLLVTVISFTACTSETDAEIETLNTELTKGHDDIMPKSMRLGNLKDKVLAKSQADTTTRDEATMIANNLQSSEDAMYKWMDNYSKAMNDEPDKNKKVEMYRTLKVEVEAISTSTDNAIKAAEGFIGN